MSGREMRFRTPPRRATYSNGRHLIGLSETLRKFLFVSGNDELAKSESVTPMGHSIPATKPAVSDQVARVVRRSSKTRRWWQTSG